MSRPEILDGSPVAILVDDRGADVRRARDGRRIAEPLADAAHDGGDLTLRLGFAPWRLVLRERDRRKHRPAPGTEVLRRELVAEMLPDVLVQLATVEVDPSAVDLVAEEARAGRRHQLADRGGEFAVDNRAPDHDLVLAAVLELQPLTADADVRLAQRRDPERARLLRVAVVADAEPALVDQPDGDRGDLLERQAVEFHVVGHREAQGGQLLGEPDQLVVLRLLLPRAVRRVVEVLLAPRGVDTRRLQLRPRARRDPDVRPRRRNRQRPHALELRLVGYLPSVGVEVAEAPLEPRT